MNSLKTTFNKTGMGIKYKKNEIETFFIKVFEIISSRVIKNNFRVFMRELYVDKHSEMSEIADD